MKSKIYYRPLVAAIIAVVITACGGKGVIAAADANDTAVADSQMVEMEFDSVVYKMSNKDMDYEASIVYPKNGDEAIIKAIRRIILENFDVKKPTGDEDFKQVLIADAKRRIAEVAGSVSEIADNEYDDYSKNAFSSKIYLDYQNDKIVTFGMKGYEYYSGAAHGMPWRRRFSVDLSTGKQLEWNDIIKPETRSRLKQILKDAVVNQYFNGEKDFDFFEFDLPAMAPAFVANGLWFGYSVYEIAPYAAGSPEAIIGFDGLADYLTDYAKELIRK